MNQLYIRRSLKAVRVNVYVTICCFLFVESDHLDAAEPLMLIVGLLIAWGGYVPSKATSVFHDSAAPKTSG